MDKRTKSVRERIAQSMKKAPKAHQEIYYGDMVLLGMERVGKTAIVNRFVNNYFSEGYTPSVNQETYECCSLIACEKDKGDGTKGKKKMVMKKSFKKSVLGKSRPLKPNTKMTRVLTVNKGAGNDSKNSAAFEEGKAKGLKTLKFNLVDIPVEIVDTQPFTYQATISNAKGFLLVCAFDVEGSVEYIEERFEDIKKMRIMDEIPVLLIANKSDIDDKVWDTEKIDTLAARLKTKYCTSSVITPGGCEDMTALMLNEINFFAEEELFQESLPEDYVYFNKNDEIEIGTI